MSFNSSKMSTLSATTLSDDTSIEFELKLNITARIIEKTEVFDIDNAYALLKHIGVSSDEKKLLKKYMTSATNGNEVSVTYSHGKDWITTRKGRVFGSGLQQFSRDVRNALAQKYYEDIDMKNAHPVILEQVCKDNNWKCECLTQYVDNRSQIIEEIQSHYNVTKDDAKNLVLRTLYLGDSQPWMKDNIISATLEPFPFILSLSAEMKAIAKNVCMFASDIRTISERQYAKANKSTTNKHPRIDSSTLAVFLQTIEHSILMSIDNFLESNGWKVGPLIFDGCMVRLDEHGRGVPEAILRECEAQVFVDQKFKINLVKKPVMTSLRMGSHSASANEGVRRVVGPNVNVTDEYAAEQFVKLMGDHIVFDKETVFVFVESTGLWSKTTSSIRAAMIKHKSKLVFYQETDTEGKFKKFEYGGSDRNARSLLQWIGPHCTKYNFFEARAASSTGKLLFTDGIYDFGTNTFTPEFDPSIVFHGRINRPFPKERNEELITKVNKALFIDPFTDEDKKMSDYLRIGISRAIFGDHRAKLIYFCVGTANAGKGVLTDALKASFETFVDSFNANDLVHNSRSGADSAKQLAWVVPISNKRLAYSNELQMSKPLDANIIKSVVSGGDSMQARVNYVDASSVNCCATLFCFLNDLPNVIPYDKACKNRIRVAEYKKTFVDINDYDGVLNDHVMAADFTLRDKFQQLSSYKDAVLHIIIDGYQEFLKYGHVVPPEVKSSTDAWTGDVGSLKAVLEEQYEFTFNMQHYAVSTEITQFLESKKIGMSKTKIGKELTGLNLKSDKQRVQGYVNSMAIWRGIREIGDENMDSELMMTSD